MVEEIFDCRLITIKPDEYRLDFSDLWQHYDYLSEQGYQGGGATWKGIAEALMKMQAPDLLCQVRLDAESDCLCVWSSSKEALRQLAQLISEANKNQTKLDAAIGYASTNSFLE